MILGSCQVDSPLSTRLDSAPVPTATQQVLRIGVTPALHSWAQTRWREYQEQSIEETNALQLVPSTAESGLLALEDSEIQLLITALLPKQEFFLTPLGHEGIAVILHPNNPIRSFSGSILQSLFIGEITDWEKLGWEGSILPLIPMPADDLRTVFQVHLLEGQPYSTKSWIGPTPNAIWQLLEDHPYAIGLIPFSDLPPTSKVARVDSILPNLETIRSHRYPLSMEVIGVSVEEPAGRVRDWVTWLQDLLPR